MNEDDQTQRSKRSFIAFGVRNILAIGVLAASGAVARITPASACNPNGNCDGDKHDEGNCFLKGTKIQTVQGERKVEDLAIGDLLPTVFGAVRPIQWMGYYRYMKSDRSKPWVRDVRPVRIKRSALAPNVPYSDLYVTQNHALFIDGALVTADRLINGTTIVLYGADEYDELEFFHVKLETHDVIHAEGAPCETMMSVSESASNFAEYLRLYGAPDTQDLPCAPISFCGLRGELMSRLRNVMSPWRGPQKLDIIRDRLEDRANSLAVG
jgi:Hint domain